MPQDYSNERYNPDLAHCGGLNLRFNGKTLVLKGGTKTRVYSAVSGKPIKGKFDYSLAAQKKPSLGPIPAGTYWIRPDEFWGNAWYKRGSYAAWGNYRITIHPFRSTQTHGRSGFFLHGGSTPGSAGCIDLTGHIDRFYKDVRSEIKDNSTCQIHLIVSYPRVKE